MGVRNRSVILVIAYLLAFVALLGFLWTLQLRELLPTWLASYHLAYNCVLIGGLGGAVYCLRAVYLNRSVHNRWDPNWVVWYIVRPLVSCLVGAVAYVFLKAGLLVLEADQNPASSSFGFLALSFVAGLNVDRFLVRIEEVARSTWSIRPSRTSEDSDNAIEVAESDDTQEIR